MWLLGHAVGPPYNQRATVGNEVDMHGSEHPFWSNPVAQMGPNVEQNYENMIEMGTNWVRCDGILSHTLGPLFKPWYHKGDILPPWFAG
jgi:hypothetical protein